MTWQLLQCSLALLLLGSLTAVKSQKPAAAPGPTSLPQIDTPLWSNVFAAVVGQQDDAINSTEGILEEAIRDQYTAIGYAIQIVDVRGCNFSGAHVSNVNNYNPSAAGPAGDARQEAPEASFPYTALPPLPSHMLVRANCYRLNATLYFDEPSSNSYLDAAAGTSNAITGAISNQTSSAGVQAEFYMLNVKLAQSVTSVVHTGDTLQHITEIGYVSSIWVGGSGVVPFTGPQQLAMLAAFSLLGFPNAQEVVRNVVQSVAQNATGAIVTYLSVVRPTMSSSSFPQALATSVKNGSFQSALQSVGLPAEHVSLVSQSQDNSTTISAQLSSLLSNQPVVSSIGLPGKNTPASHSPGPAQGTRGLSSGAIAGVVVGGLAAAALLALLGVYTLRQHKALRQTQDSKGKSRDSPPPGPPPSLNTSPMNCGSWGPTPTVSHAISQASVGQTSLPIDGWSRGTWRLDPQSITICKRPDGSDYILGHGSYGIVYKGIMDGEKEVAVKLLSKVDEWQLKQFKHEIDLLRSLSHGSNVVQFYGACLNTECPFLVLEYMAGGDLRDALSDPRFSPLLDWHRKGQKIAADVARGLMFLHSKNIIHADLKSKNVLLAADMRMAKIADVGLSRIMHGSHASSTSDALGGTFSYAAPELILGYKLTTKVDSFAFSVLLWEIICKDPPLRGQLHSIEAPKLCPPEIVALIDQGMQRAPKKRFSAKEAYEIIAAVSTEEDRYSDVDVNEIPQLLPFSIYGNGEKWER